LALTLLEDEPAPKARRYCKAIGHYNLLTPAGSSGGIGGLDNQEQQSVAEEV